MNLAGLPQRARATVGGTVFAQLRAVTLAGMAAIASTAGYSGCVLSPTLVPDDVNLLPLTPVSITSASPKLPGSMILFDETRDAAGITFDVTVASDFAGQLQVRWYANRDRPCTGTGTSCGTLLNFYFLDPTDSGLLRQLRSEFIPSSNFPLGSCTRVDLYVSTDFKTTALEETEPTRPGDVMFARWFVARRDALTHLPTVDSCVPSGMAQ